MAVSKSLSLLALLPLISSVAALSFWSSHKHHERRLLRRDTAASTVNWTAITPSEDLEWTPCDSDFQCARLSIPMDYTSPDGPKTQIALRLSPAANNSTSKGTILVNPGGPGIAGTSYLYTQLSNIRNMTGPDFGLLGFDPRGTGASTPSSLCFASDAQLSIWSADVALPLNVSDTTIPNARGRAEAMGRLCEKAMGGEAGIGRFMDTASVARDMLTIVEKLGEEKLQFYGVSYGTILGQYFATLFPDRVGRMILDGVSDAKDAQSLTDTSAVSSLDEVASSFYSFCHTAGPSQCSLYESTADAIRARVDAIMQSIRAAPLGVPFAPTGPALVTVADLQIQRFTSTYDPSSEFAPLADLLLAVEQNNQTALQSSVAGFPEDAAYSCLTPSATPTPYWLRENQSIDGIKCSDAAPINDSAAFLAAYVQNFTAVSAVGGPYWAVNRVNCEAWPLQAKARYAGAIGAANTSSAILFVSAVHDPVTPLAGAQHAQTLFPGSGLLMQSSYGHTATMLGTQASRSACTTAHVYEYWINGTLPANGTTCEAGIQAFGLPGNVTV